MSTAKAQAGFPNDANFDAIAPNAKRLLFAGFMAILAAGVGFSVRGGILQDWGSQFGFTQSDLGLITGGGLTGFGIIIILSALIADKIGYGPLLITAFVMHFLSAVVTLAATPVYNSMKEANPAGAHDTVYWMLYIGMFMFAIGNGLCEAVVNPMVATLFPRKKSHYLNILHAGWPAGLVAGGLASAFMAGKVRWEVQMSLFLIPVLLYGFLCFGQKFPKSEAVRKGVSFAKMLAQFAAPLLLFLLVIHAMLGYVELGTDSWISNITGNIVGSKQNGLFLFVYTSSLMFILRFFAGPIVHRISPLGLLFVGACCGATGLTLLGHADLTKTTIAVIGALTIYGIGKTFLWPTMLAVASERFPAGGAIVIGAMGGIGMLSAGMLGGPGIGYCQDRAASAYLEQKDPAVYDMYKSPEKNQFLFFEQIQGLNGGKVNKIRDIEAKDRTPDETIVHDADLHGGRMALAITAGIPATMAVCYLLLILY
ncbi:MAG TPA: MFS transporter, partial [Pirellulales bacterium]|nr:MFS transporter [Pirellulales bacterium]